jgi:hypothetical protein
LDCDLDGEVVITDCILEGIGVITVPPIPPPCTRPITVIPYELITGYDILDPLSNVVSTASQVDACNAITYVTTNQDFIYTFIIGQALSLTLFQTVYANNGTNDCSVVPDGWYFTDESANTTTNVYHIVSGVITEIVQCVATTTTTTTMPCYSFTVTKTTVGIVTVSFIDCSGNPATRDVGLPEGGFSTQTFCARSVTTPTPTGVSLTNNGPC